MDDWRGKHLNTLAWLVRPSAVSFTTNTAVELHSLRRIPPPESYNTHDLLVGPREVDEGRGVHPGHGAGDVQVRRVSLSRASWQDPDTGGRG